MYIGDVFIDELNSIEWGLNHNVVPLYGYCSRDADAYAEGRAGVSGQILLNYVAPWYLGVALQRYTERAPDDLEPLESEREKQAYALAQSMSRGQIPSNIAQLDQQVVSRANQLRRVGQFAYLDVGEATYKRMTFNIVLEFGDRERKNRRLLEHCKLIGHNMIVDQSGNPIFESYGFIARRVL
jgi:hypothetical protein